MIDLKITSQLAVDLTPAAANVAYYPLEDCDTLWLPDYFIDSSGNIAQNQGAVVLGVRINDQWSPEIPVSILKGCRALSGGKITGLWVRVISKQPNGFPPVLTLLTGKHVRAMYTLDPGTPSSQNLFVG